MLPTRTAKSFEKQFPNLASVPYPGEYSENFARLMFRSPLPGRLAAADARHAGRQPE